MAYRHTKWRNWSGISKDGLKVPINKCMEMCNSPSTCTIPTEHPSLTCQPPQEGKEEERKVWWLCVWIVLAPENRGRPIRFEILNSVLLSNAILVVCARIARPSDFCSCPWRFLQLLHSMRMTCCTHGHQTPLSSFPSFLIDLRGLARETTEYPCYNPIIIPQWGCDMQHLTTQMINC